MSHLPDFDPLDGFDPLGLDARRPSLLPCRAIRSDGDPTRAPLPPPPPYPFDGSDPLAVLAVVRLAQPSEGPQDDAAAIAAAARLCAAYETATGRTLSLADAVSWWWQAARRCADVAALMGRPGLSPNALRMRAVRPVHLPPGRAYSPKRVSQPRNRKGVAGQIQSPQQHPAISRSPCALCALTVRLTPREPPSPRLGLA
jgi:hypothetical protein